MIATQGHKYLLTLTGREVLALSSGDRPQVAHLLPNQFWPLGSPFDVDAALLEAMPMRYHHGEIPK